MNRKTFLKSIIGVAGLLTIAPIILSNKPTNDVCYMDHVFGHPGLMEIIIEDNGNYRHCILSKTHLDNIIKHGWKIYERQINWVEKYYIA